MRARKNSSALANSGGRRDYGRGMLDDGELYLRIFLGQIGIDLAAPPVVPDGYGSNYAIGKERIRLSVSSWKSAPQIDAVSFRTTLETVFNDLGEAIERS